jgi:hypothetical protein
MSKRMEEARTARDQALALARAHGRWRAAGAGRVFMAEVGGFKIALVAPFQPEFHDLPDPVRYARAAAGWLVSTDWLLDVWVDRKVLSVRWHTSPPEDLELCTFKRGPWQVELAQLARGEVAA